MERLSSYAIMPATMNTLKAICTDNVQSVNGLYHRIEQHLHRVLIYAETLALSRGNLCITVRDIIDACKSIKLYTPVNITIFCVRDVLSLSPNQTHISVSDTAAKFFTPPKLTIDTFYSFYKGRQPLIPQNPPIADIISLYDHFSSSPTWRKEYGDTSSLTSRADGTDESAEPEEDEPENIALVPSIAPELSFLIKEILYHAENSINDKKSHIMRTISEKQFKQVSNALPQHLILLIESACEQGKLSKIILHLKVLLILIVPYGPYFIPYLSALIPLMIKLSAITKLANDYEMSSTDMDCAKMLDTCDIFDSVDIARIKELVSNSSDSKTNSSEVSKTVLEAHKWTIVIRQLAASILSHLAMLSLTFDPMINEKIGSVLINTFIKTPDGICSWGLVSALVAVSSNNCIGLFINKLLSCPDKELLIARLKGPSPQYSTLGLDGGWCLLKDSVRARVQSIMDLTEGTGAADNYEIALSRVPLGTLVDIFGPDLLA